VNEDDENRTALHQSVNIGSEIGAELLLQHGASTDTVDVRMWTALHYAGYHEDMNCADMLLLRGANPTLKDYNDQDCVELAPEGTPIHERLLRAREATEEKQRKAEQAKLELNTSGGGGFGGGFGGGSGGSASFGALSPMMRSTGGGVMMGMGSSPAPPKEEEEDGGIFSIFSGKSIKEGLNRFLKRRPSIADVAPIVDKK
jgi:hypothetical protein